MLAGQFTYTASSRAGLWDSQPGWKIQSVVGVPGKPALDEKVVRAAARTVGGFVPPALPELASHAEVEELPRCLRLDLLDGGLVCVSHIVAAGPDYSQRPNFFAHGLIVDPMGEVDEEDDAAGIVCPADLWGAELWLRPIGAQQVESTEPDADLTQLVPGPLDQVELEQFAREHANRRASVLAAVERRLDGGGPLVLVGDDPQSIVQWLRLVGSLLLPSAAWRLRFSTYERLAETEVAAGWPFDVVGVPATDWVAAAELPGARFSVLRDDDRPVPRAGNHWVLPDGSDLVAGPWARLAEVVAVMGLLPLVAEQLEWLADELGNSTREEPLWALGAAVLLVDDLPLDELAQDAAALVLERWPHDLECSAVIHSLLQRLRERRSWPDIVAALRSRLEDDPHGLVEQLLVLELIREALASPAAFLGSGNALCDAVAQLGPAVEEELDEVLAAALEWVPDSGSVIAPRALLQMAAMTGPTSALRGRLGLLGRQLLVPRLLDRRLDPRLLRWPRMSAWFWQHLRPALAEELARAQQRGDHDAGRALSGAVHEWLGDLGLERGPVTSSALRRTGPVEWERAAHRTFWARPRPTLTPLERAGAFLSVAHNEGWRQEERAEKARAHAYRAEQLLIADLPALMECAPAEVSFAGVVVDLLEGTPPSAESAVAAAQLRAREPLLRSQERALAPHLALHPSTAR